MGSSSSVPEHTVLLHYVPWRDDAVWRAFFDLGQRRAAEGGVTFRLVDALEDYEAAQRAGVAAQDLPAIICRSGGRTAAVFRRPDPTFSDLVQWLEDRRAEAVSG